MIHDELATYEVAKLAKEKGFNEKCNFYYQKGVISTDGCFNRYNKGVEYICSAPTQSLLQRWLREEKGYYVYPFFDNVQLKWDWVCREKTGDKWIPLVGLEFRLFPTYELALEDALKYVLENFV